MLMYIHQEWRIGEMQWDVLKVWDANHVLFTPWDWSFHLGESCYDALVFLDDVVHKIP